MYQSLCGEHRIYSLRGVDCAFSESCIVRVMHILIDELMALACCRPSVNKARRRATLARSHRLQMAGETAQLPLPPLPRHLTPHLHHVKNQLSHLVLDR